eukprot:gnl/TRDRNA2_/TRDRNA2_163763_c2_seq3.p1 gnl/TRDRNA2_/TRDRNA2_163763_c2~~gnl/TRDRNA2_/TRDRNA2_163763_c2_seq3.p1  ORF type:complete len:282 (+),score=69.80 gnl/TRDRNA2_/TRDRNA2_163763_c2_seq3:92-937(+)
MEDMAAAESEGLEHADGWADDVETELDSFMQEDALLDAIRSAPAEEHQAFPAEAVDCTESITSGSGVNSPGVVSLAPVSSSSTGAPLDAASGGSADKDFDNLCAMLSAEARSAGSPGGPKERRPDAEQRPSAASQQAKGAAGPPKQKSRPLPSGRSALLTVACLVGLLLYGPGLVGGDAPKEKKAPVKMTPRIMLPAIEAIDEALESMNATVKQAVRAGTISTQWSSESASNITIDEMMAAAANGNSTASETPREERPRDDRGRRGRLRKGGGGGADGELR